MKKEKILKQKQKNKIYIDKYNQEGINFPSEKDDCKKLEKKNLTVALLYVLFAKKEKIYPAYVSKHNSNRERQIILLMIPNGEGWHYLAVKRLSALLSRITSKYDLNLIKRCVKIKIFVL